ncbi:DNA recombination protein RmuC [Portibacter marinus]|uniref:DNA recombination protein RmuC n=1 Tax=Portibacter marinus TaxID=2898660 RepID=UPI001F358CB9|nr:DNA recombination protein RmuC [Portibacter marinus]
MDQLFVVLVVLVMIVVGMLIYNLLQIQNVNKSLLSKNAELELVLNKHIQENFFNFQSVILRQLDQQESQRQFIFNQINKDQKNLHENVSKNLGEMREIVEEKLHKTLENRLSHSFKLVSDSLTKVQKGLGEMQVLANGVGDLKRVLSNTKSRGVLGEIQLSSILEQLLTQEQYALNVSTIPNTRNHVEFAIKFPGNNEKLPYIWLPIDSKFPLDVYEQLLDAYEDGDKQEVMVAKKKLSNAVKTMAGDIQRKYIYPPYTTEFAIMFLPTESLYAEVLRIPGLIMDIQNDNKIMMVGPNNLGAFLTSLQQGFKSLAIEKRTDEVWKLLSTVRTEFGRFGDILDKTQKKILEANKIIETASSKSRTIERKLKGMEKISFLD